jgi:hypothetical protein
VIGLYNPSNIFSLCWLVDLHKLDMILLQETMGVRDKITWDLLKFMKDWDFLCINFVGSSKVLIIGWRKQTIRLTSSVIFELGVGVELISLESRKFFFVVTTYAPYENRWLIGRIMILRESIILF